VPSGSSSGLPQSKAIGSLAKKQPDITRQGTQKFKFVPTLPARRKKECVSSSLLCSARSTHLYELERLKQNSHQHVLLLRLLTVVAVEAEEKE